MSTQAPGRPTRGTGKRLGRYLYAIIDAAADRELGPFGLDGGTVYTVGDGKLSAVVSDVPNERVRPERRRLAAHHEVLKRLMAEQTVLPIAFGLIADGDAAVRKLLAEHRATLTQQIQRVAGKVEMGLRVLWDVPNIFEFFVATHPDLRLLRDQIFRGNREPSQDDKIELGRMFDRALTDERANLTERVTSVLRPYCAELKENKPRNEREVMNLACLIDRAAQKKFERAIFEAARFFDNHYAFDFNGPWPPHNFVEMSLQS